MPLAVALLGGISACGGPAEEGADASALELFPVEDGGRVVGQYRGEGDPVLELLLAADGRFGLEWANPAQEDCLGELLARAAGTWSVAGHAVLRNRAASGP